MDWGFLGGWMEKLRSALQRQRTNLHIADGARRLQRRLAGLPDWPDRALGGQDLSAWAARLFKGLLEAGPEVRWLAKLTPVTSPGVQRAIGESSAHFDQATHLLGALFGKDAHATAWDDARRAEIEATLRKVVGHVRECRDALRSVDKS